MHTTRNTNNQAQDKPRFLWLVDGGPTIGFQTLGDVYIQVRLNLACDDGNMRYDFNGNQYELNLTNMTQRNLKTGMQRKVVRLEMQSDCAILSRDFSITFNNMNASGLRAWITSQGGSVHGNWDIGKLKAEAASIYRKSSEFPHLQLKDGTPFPIRTKRNKRNLYSGAVPTIVTAPSPPSVTTYRPANKIPQPKKPAAAPEINPKQVVEQLLKSRGEEDLIVRVVTVKSIMRDPLARQFEAHKELLLGATEILVFHGTTSAKVPLIVEGGFDHRLNVRSCYGVGNYFAKYARYSLQNHFGGQLDAQGHATVLVAKILVRDTTRGTSDMKVPPFGKDTAVNDPDNPSIFVTFKDAQSLPFFEIKFLP